jgi:hypothetical protein
MLTRFLVLVATLCVIGDLVLHDCRAAERAPADAANLRCEALAHADFSVVDEAPTEVTSAQFIEATKGLPSYCEVKGYVWPQVGFELQLPATGWKS